MEFAEYVYESDKLCWNSKRRYSGIYAGDV